MKLRNGILACLLAAMTVLSGPASLVVRAQVDQPDAFQTKADKRLKQIRRAADETVSAPTRVARERAAAEVEKFSRVAGVRRGAKGEVTVGLFVQLRGQDASELREAGFAVGSVVGDIATVETEASRLGELAALGSVVKLSASTVYRPVNDRARQAIGIDNSSAQRVVGQTGAGVVVGVIDSGIDFRHRDFTRPGSNGTQTRIKFLLDMTVYTTTAADWDYTLPGGSAKIGKLYTESDINAALAAAKPSDQNADTVKERDKSGHGTHVAGTAAGNGLGAPAAPGTYAGMAPAADLIIVKASRQNTGSASFRTDDTINALQFIQVKSAELNEPFVVNMSLGGQAGSHDGTGADERAIDNLVAGGAGRVVCIAAGNEGADNVHARTTIPAGGSVTLNLTAHDPDFVDLYYKTSDRFTVTLKKPDGTTFGPISFSASGFNNSSGQASDSSFKLWNALDNKGDNDPSNDQPDIFLDFNTDAPDGTWELTITDADGAANSEFDAWTSGFDSSTNALTSFANFVDNDSHLVASPGTARGAITVGAFVTRSASQTIGNFAPFTSPGPTADGRLKPDITAPGYYLYSTRSSDVASPSMYTYGTGSNALASGVDQTAYGGLAGTSMSTPVATGSVALLLQLNRNLTSNQIKAFIVSSAAHDNFTGSGWTPRFGNGKLNIAAAMNPINDSTSFVTQHYRDFLGRDPDASGLQFWVNEIEQCGGDMQCREVKRINVSNAFFLSIEFQETGFYAIRVQRAAFNRRSDTDSSRMTFSELTAAQQQIGAGVIVGQPGYQQVLETNKNNYAAQIVATSNFASRFPQTTADTFVDALYASAGLTPTAAERTAAINAYNNPGSVGASNSRSAALRVVSDSNTVRSAELNTAYVLMEYIGYLRRNPDASGYNFWLTKLNQFNGDAIAAEMVKAFITSIEYRQRFGTP